MASSTDPFAETMRTLSIDSRVLQPQSSQPSKNADEQIKHECGPFRLLDLPSELQLNVVEKHFEGSELNFSPNTEGTLMCRSVSSLKLECASKLLRELCIKIRNGKIKRRLLCEMPVNIHIFVRAFTSEPKYAWIRNHIESILFGQGLTFNRPPDWQRLCTNVPNLVQVCFLPVSPCQARNAASGVLLKTAARDADSMAGILADGMLDSAVPSLVNNDEVSRLCKSLNRSNPGKSGVSLIAILQFLSNTSEPLFSMQIEEAMSAAKGLVREAKYIYMKNGSIVTFTGKSEPIKITESSGTTRTWERQSQMNACDIHPDDIEDLFRSLGVDPQAILAGLNLGQGEGEEDQND